MEHGAPTILAESKEPKPIQEFMFMREEALNEGVGKIM